MARIRLRLDDKGLRDDIRQAFHRTPQAGIQALRMEQLNLFNASQAEVPVDKGPLAESGQTPLPRIRGTLIEAVVEYTAPYALSVHENPRSGRTGGVSPQGRRYRTWAQTGKWKYLEHPTMRAEPGFASRIGRFLERVWR